MKPAGEATGPDPKGRVLIVDDEPAVVFALREFLELFGFEVSQADGCAAAKREIERAQVDALVMDYSLPDGDAFSLMAELKAHEMLPPTIILTAYGSIELAVRAIKEGAQHFLVKPVELSALAVLLERVLDTERLRRRFHAKTISKSGIPNPFVGHSKAIRNLAHRCSDVSSSDVAVVLWGEAGCGKGVLAKWLHENSPRKDGAFVDCAGISPELLESELFGHEKGAFTGAVGPKKGLFEIAHGGTLFLDEIGDMQPGAQAKLLQVLEEKRFRRVGAVQARGANFRLIAATHHDLRSRVQEGKFRADLFFRISAMELRLPSLRERPEDIPELAQLLLSSINAEIRRGPAQLQADALMALQSLPWEGNIRQLRNVLERAALLIGHEVLTAQDLLLHNSTERGPEAGGLSLSEMERAHIAKVLAITQGQVAAAAKLLGISKSTLYAKLKENEPQG